ncbi:uncharacterized protein EI90DRAFT_3156522 [Cantharellus anzutake]|uniref:uncharacterized protein n=1 Tax=Cantharellus anzutake TaxID=1750568 RepID=UPI0019063D50|nr:uncharacterized protein EI90DRAFT_3156522 [Cantharellus anzutake]KAF8326591.1 hypothetical protein EI90DRAFT_3156522 [Cantharellus anzutake]
MKKTTIIGIAVGGAAGVIIIGTAAYVVRTRSRSAARKTPPTATNGLRTSAGFGAIAGRDTGDFVGSAGGVVQVPSAAHGVSTAVGMAGNRAPFAFGGAPVAAPVVRTFAESGFGVTENPNVFTSIGPGTGTAAAPRTRASISSARTYASRTATSPVTAASFYPPEVANATNAGSLSPTQSPSYLSDSAPRSPESASPGLSSPQPFLPRTQIHHIRTVMSLNPIKVCRITRPTSLKPTKQTEVSKLYSGENAICIIRLHKTIAFNSSDAEGHRLGY